MQWNDRRFVAFSALIASGVAAGDAAAQQPQQPVVTVVCTTAAPGNQVCTKEVTDYSYSWGDKIGNKRCVAWSTATAYACQLVSDRRIDTPMRVTVQK